MTTRLALIATLLLLAACVSTPDRRPRDLIEAEQQLGQGTRAFRNDDYRSAAALFRRALDYYRSVDDAEGQARALINLAETALAVDDRHAAHQHLAALTRLSPRLPQTGLAPRIGLLEARLALREGRADEATRLLDGLLARLPEDRRRPEDPLYQALLLRRAEAALAGPTPADAEPRLQPLLPLADRGRLAPEMQARLLRLQAELLLLEDRPDAACAQLEQALAVARQSRRRPAIAAALEALAAQSRHQGRLREAAELLERALPVRSRLLDQAALRRDLESLLALYRELGDGEAERRIQATLARLPAQGPARP